MPGRNYNQRLQALIDMHTYKRPHGSLGDLLFCERFLFPLPGAREDDHGNIIVTIPKADGSASMVLWSSHTDTVHRTTGRQRVRLRNGWLTVREQNPDCLGADDSVGVWIMREMILAGVPGCYVFHFGEEVGGIGSSALAEDNPAWLAGIKAAIALDRQGTQDVITHQGYGRCCSDTFALSLAKQLPAGYKPCDRGVYTDTAEYTTLVAECTNLSVGYYSQHRGSETLHVPHAFKLLRCLLAFDESLLVIERDTAEDNYATEYAEYRAWLKGTNTPEYDNYDRHTSDQRLDASLDWRAYCKECGVQVKYCDCGVPTTRVWRKPSADEVADRQRSIWLDESQGEILKLYKAATRQADVRKTRAYRKDRLH